MAPVLRGVDGPLCLSELRVLLRGSESVHVVLGVRAPPLPPTQQDAPQGVKARTTSWTL